MPPFQPQYCHCSLRDGVEHTVRNRSDWNQHVRQKRNNILDQEGATQRQQQQQLQPHTSVLHSPVRTAVQTVWTGSVQSRPPGFLDCMKTVRPVRGFSGRGWTAVDCQDTNTSALTPKRLSQHDRPVPSIRLCPPNLNDGNTTRQETPSSGTADSSCALNSDKHPLNRVQSASYRRQHPQGSRRGGQGGFTFGRAGPG